MAVFEQSGRDTTQGGAEPFLRERESAVFLGFHSSLVDLGK